MVFNNYSPRSELNPNAVLPAEEEEEKSEELEGTESKYDSRMIIGEGMETIQVEERFVPAEEQARLEIERLNRIDNFLLDLIEKKGSASEGAPRSAGPSPCFGGGKHVSRTAKALKSLSVGVQQDYVNQELQVEVPGEPSD